MDSRTVLLYRIAEATGKSVEEVATSISTDEFYGWGEYFASPFCETVRLELMIGWLTHVVRSIVSKKGRSPQFKDSVPPFDRIYSEHFRKARAELEKIGGISTVGSAGKVSKPNVSLMEIEARAYQLRYERERWKAKFERGEVIGPDGLKKGETFRDTRKPKGTVSVKTPTEDKPSIVRERETVRPVTRPPIVPKRIKNLVGRRGVFNSNSNGAVEGDAGGGLPPVNA